MLQRKQGANGCGALVTGTARVWTASASHDLFGVFFRKKNRDAAHKHQQVGTESSVDCGRRVGEYRSLIAAVSGTVRRKE